MANVKISQLPSWTGSAADQRWFVMNDAAETETFKFSGYTSQVIPGNGVDSFVTINVPSTHAPDDYMLVFGNHSGTTASSGANSAVLGGRNNKTTNQFGIVAGGLNNTAGYICGVFGGNGGNADGNTAMIIGGENNTCSNVAWGGIFNGIQNYMGGGNDVGNGIIGGYENRLSINGVYGSHIFGGRSNRWHHFDSRSEDTRFSYGAMMGGYLNRIEGNSTDSVGAHAFPIIIGSKSSKIFGEESDDTGTTGATILNSFTSNIKDTSWSSIVGGINHNILSSANSSLIGGDGSAISASTNSNVIGGYQNNVINQETSGIYSSYGSEINQTSGGNNNTIIGSETSKITGLTQDNCTIIGSVNSNIYHSNFGNYHMILGAEGSTIDGQSSGYNHIIGGSNNNIVTTTDGNNTILNGNNNTISGKTNVVMLSCTGRTATTSNATFVENLVVFNYAGLDFANDTAAAAGGVVLGQVYHNAGALRIRIV